MLHSISSRFFVAAFATASLPLVLAVSVIAFREYESSIDSAAQVQLEVAKRVGVRIESFFSKVSNVLSIPTDFQDLEGLRPDEQRQWLSQVLSLRPFLLDLAFLARDGTIQAYAARYDVRPPPRLVTPAMLAGAASSKEIRVGPVRFDEKSGMPSLQIVRAVGSRQSGRTYGFLVATVDLRSIWEIFSLIRFEPGESAYLTDVQGKLVAHQNPTFVLQGMSSSFRPEARIQHGLNGQRAIVSGYRLGFGQQEFRVIAERDFDNALGGFFHLLLTAITVLGLSMLLAVLLEFVAIRRVVRPIEAVSEAARSIQDGDLSARVSVASTGQIAELATTFNKMAQTMEELVGTLRETKLHQHQIIEERTAKLRRANSRLKKEVSERKKAEAKAISANEAKSRFLANASHELRTPLNAIIGFSQMINLKKFGPVGQPRYEEYIELIEQSAQHLLGIINGILDLSKLEAGKFDLATEDLDLAEIALDTVKLMRPQAEQRDVKLSLAMRDHMPAILGDPRLLRQIFLNLVSNALKFTPAGGDIRVKVFVDGAGCPSFLVSDSGIGMTEEEIQQAISPFEQPNITVTNKDHGTGLGLPLCKLFAELHGGILEIDSTPGKGTKVTVRLPADRLVGQLADCPVVETITDGARRKVRRARTEAVWHGRTLSEKKIVG